MKLIFCRSFHSWKKPFLTRLESFGMSQVLFRMKMIIWSGKLSWKLSQKWRSFWIFFNALKKDNLCSIYGVQLDFVSQALASQSELVVQSTKTTEPRCSLITGWCVQLTKLQIHKAFLDWYWQLPEGKYVYWYHQNTQKSCFFHKFLSLRCSFKSKRAQWLNF